jgi:hypothetical protein
MANQMVALQARGPQLPDMGALTARFGNMMAQQQASNRQTEAAQQTINAARANETRAAAEEARKAALHPSALAKGVAEATAEEIKVGLDFNNFVRLSLANSNTPDQVAAFAERIAAQPQFKSPVFQGILNDAVQSMPTEPAAFEDWKKNTKLSTLAADKQYEQKLQTQKTGTEERIISIPAYGGPATEVPGSRFQSAQDIQYVKGPDDSVRAMPKNMPGTGGFGAPAPAAPAAGLVGGARGGGIGPSIEQVAQQLSPGVVVSGRARTPARNAQVGGVPDSYHLTDNARDLQPGKGQTLAGLYNSLAPLKAQGFDVVKERNHVHVEPSPGKAPAPRGGAGGLQFGQVVPGMQGSGKKDGKTTEAERRFGTVSKQMRSNLEEAANILTSSPEVIKPSGTEYAAKQIPFYGEEASMFAQSEARQQFVPAVLRFLDNVTFVNTGAGVTAEQQKNYMRSYVPTYQDTPASAHRKLVNMIVFAKNIKDAAGSQWTPDMDASFKTLEQAVAKLKPTAKPAATGRKTPTGVDNNNPLLKG